MKYFLVICMFVVNTCFGQPWEAEVMAGISGYNGDLSYSNISFKNVGPSVNLNIKYLLPNKYLVLRGGISYGKISANDKNNKDETYKKRDLSFKTNILEASVCLELNLLDPDYFLAYPYVFAGAGVFHFNPYTYDKDNKKTYLQPLGTEGQGLPEYPNRKMYSRTQFCIPFGGGWKWNINDRYGIIYELGGRFLFTDYLDDVSTTYADPAILLAARGATSAELANRWNPNFSVEGRKRGNAKSKDWYYMTGIKFMIRLGKNSKEE